MSLDVILSVSEIFGLVSLKADIISLYPLSFTPDTELTRLSTNLNASNVA